MIDMFSYAGLAIVMCALVAELAGRIKRHQMYGLWAVGYSLALVYAVASHAHFMAGFDAATVAVCVRLWCRGGGGDSTKRRLRKLARAFTPVRRTAPQGA